MKNLFIIFFSIILPLSLMSLAMSFFVSPKTIEPIIVAIGYLFAGVTLVFWINRKWNNTQKIVSFLSATSLIYLSWMIGGKAISSPNNFIDGLGYFFFGFILFLSQIKKLASIRL